MTAITGRLTYGRPWGTFYLGGSPYLGGSAGVTEVYPDSILVDVVVDDVEVVEGSAVRPNSALVDVIVDDVEVTVSTGVAYPDSALVGVIVGRPTVLGGVTAGQWSAGTVDLTNGSATVSGVATKWSGAVTAGNYLIVLDADLSAAAVAYRITADATDESLTIAVPWPGPTTEGLPYVIHRDINARGMPRWSKTDLGLPQLWNRSMMIINNAF